MERAPVTLLSNADSPAALLIPKRLSSGASELACNDFQTYPIEALPFRGAGQGMCRGTGGDGLPSQEIAGQMIARTPDITRLVDRLEQAGLVERSRTPEDRRVVLVKITEAGREVLARLDRPVLELHTKLLGHLSRDELAELNRLLVKARTPK